MAKPRKHKRSAVIITTIFLLIFAVVGYFVLSGYIEKQIYMLKHENIIEQMSSKYELDPYLVCAVIYSESKFDDDVVSSAGAVGLMQIMPATGEWIANKAGISEYSKSALTDPKMNIQLGCWYLNYLEKKFDGNTDLMVAAYNAGPQKVTTWLNDSTLSSDGKTLSSIPYKETENYVKRINSAYEKYKRIYKDTFK